MYPAVPLVHVRVPSVLTPNFPPAFPNPFRFPCTSPYVGSTRWMWHAAPPHIFPGAHALSRTASSTAAVAVGASVRFNTMRTRADAMSAEELSTFRPDVLARRDAEDAEAESGRLTDLELFLSRLRRFKPPAPIDAGFNAVKKVALSIGASAALKRARAAHDATRRKRAKALMENLLDAALGGRGDEVKRFAGDRLCLPVGSEAWKQKEAKDAAARAAAKALNGVDPHARPPTPPKGQKGLAKPIPKSAAVTSKDKGKTAEEEAE